jgi:lipopolysaccharide transport system ATP-binding protein
VGDALFQKRCYRKIEALQQQGVALLFVSHDQETVRSLTQRALLLDRGNPLMLGSSGEVVLAYRQLLHDAERAWHQPVLGQLGEQQRAATTGGDGAADKLQFGDGSARIVDVRLCDASGSESNVFATGDPMRIEVRFLAVEACEHLSIGLRIRNRQGVKVYGWGLLNQDMAIRAGLATGEQFWPRRFEAGTEHTVTFTCECRLGADFYEVQVAVSHEDTPDYKNQRLLHWRDEAAFFQVTMSQDDYFFGGAFDLQMRAEA